MAFNISLSEAATEDVIVSFSTVNGTATAGSDFVGVSGGQATIEAGQLGTNVSIQLLDDQSTESAEAFPVQINGAQLAVSGTQLQIFRSEEHTSELQSLMRTSYAVFCLNKKNDINYLNTTSNNYPTL